MTYSMMSLELGISLLKNSCAIVNKIIVYSSNNGCMQKRMQESDVRMLLTGIQSTETSCMLYCECCLVYGLLMIDILG